MLIFWNFSLNNAFFSFLIFIFLNLVILIGDKLLYNIVVVFATPRHESAVSTHVCPHPEPPSHLSPHLLPLGCPRAPVLGALLHALNLHWSCILYVVIYISMLFFQITPASPSPT